jgi:hypothetical protein
LCKLSLPSLLYSSKFSTSLQIWQWIIVRYYFVILSLHYRSLTEMTYNKCSKMMQLLEKFGNMFKRAERYVIVKLNCASWACHLCSTAPSLALVCKYDNGLLSVIISNFEPSR